MPPAETGKPESIANVRRPGFYQKTGRKEEDFLLQHEKRMHGILLCLLAIRRGCAVYKH